MKTKIWLILIFLLAFGLRFYQLGKVPFGFVNDEAAFGYNAYSLIHTGKDEFNKAWPMVFRSFGEGKMPVYFYLTIPSILVFGLNEFAVRFPSALLGSLTVLLVYFLVKEISKSKSSLWPLLSALILTTLPWHIHFSRAAFEPNVGLFWMTLGSLFFFKFIKSAKLKLLFFSLFSFTLAIYSYNAFRIIIPFWLLYLVWKSRRKTKLTHLFLSAFIIVFVPWLVLISSKQSLGRFNGISIFNPQSAVMLTLEEKFRETRNQPLWLVRTLHNKLTAFTLDYYRRYVSHFDLSFLFFTGDPLQPRYRVPGTGQAFWLFVPFFFIGLYQIAKKRYWSILVWLLLSPIASALTFETPGTLRSQSMAVPLAIIIALGVTWTVKRLALLRWPLIILFSYCFIAYLDAYFIHAPMHEPINWQGGYRQLVKRVTELMPDYDQAIITDGRGTAYIFFLFYTQYDPAKWQAQAQTAVTLPDKFGFSTMSHLDNLFFEGEPCPAHVPLEKVLYVCTEIAPPEPGFIEIDRIYFENEQTAFVLYKANNETKTNIN